MRSFMKDKLEVRIYDNRTLMGEAAAADISARIKALLATKPEYELGLNAESRFLDDFYITLAYNFATYGNDAPSKNKNELNLRTSYRFMDRIGAFIEGNNLLNREYVKYAGYFEQGINILLGLCATF